MISMTPEQDLLHERHEARMRKDYVIADQLRQELFDRYNISVEDHPNSESTLTKRDIPKILTTSSSEPKNPRTGRRGKQIRDRKRKSLTKERFRLFRNWVLDEFSHLDLHHAGILDVAGGRGKLALLFSIENDIPCTVVDPRVSAWSMHRRKQILAQASKIPPVAIEPPNPEWLAQVFPDLDKDRDPGVSRYLRSIQLNVHRCLFNAEYCTTENLAHVGLAVGLHPDEATEDIIDQCIEHHVPFAVMPCCVFPNLFPSRKIRSTGQAVRTLDQFIVYLQEKHAGIQLVTLSSLQGTPCNRILYYHPS